MSNVVQMRDESVTWYRPVEVMTVVAHGPLLTLLVRESNGAYSTLYMMCYNEVARQIMQSALTVGAFYAVLTVASTLVHFERIPERAYGVEVTG